MPLLMDWQFVPGKTTAHPTSRRESGGGGSHDRAHRWQGSHTRAHLAAGSHDVIPLAAGNDSLVWFCLENLETSLQIVPNPCHANNKPV